MYKKHRALKEIWLFIRRHIIICVLCVVCAFIITKYSQLPMPDWLPQFFHNLFLCPSADTAHYEWLSLLNNLSLAFLASIIVYIVVQYIPERRKANKAFSLLRKEFVSLYSSMSQMICMYFFELGVTEKEEKIKLEQLSGVCEIDFSDFVRKCRIRDLKNGRYINCVSIGYTLYKDSLECYQQISKAIGKIKETKCSANLDNDIVNTISVIENNWFLRFFSYEKSIIATSSKKNKIINFDKGFYEIIKCHIELNEYAFDKMTYEYVGISNAEYEEEKEKSLFIRPRNFYLYMGETEATKTAENIIKLEPTELRLRKSEGVMLEMLAYYDSAEQKSKEILLAALQIAKYVYLNETGFTNEVIAFINIAQIKKRLNTLSESNKKILHLIETHKPMRTDAIVGSAILCKDYVLASEVFEAFSEEDKQFFIQLPIYHLWDNPPMKANPNPMSFLYMGNE